MSISKKEQRGLVSSEDSTALKSHIQLLRDQGLMVELREISDSDHPSSKMLPSSTDSPGLEELSPESAWRAYLKDTKMRESINGQDHDSLLGVGLEILEEIESSTGGAIQNRGVQRDLRLTSTSVTGFGPFEDTITYPLDNRGLVLLRGTL